MKRMFTQDEVVKIVQKSINEILGYEPEENAYIIDKNIYLTGEMSVEGDIFLNELSLSWKLSLMHIFKKSHISFSPSSGEPSNRIKR